MNLAYVITGNDLIVIKIETADIRQGAISVVGYVNEKSYYRLKEFTHVTVLMNIEATDGRLEYIYRLRPHYVERISRENGISKVKLNSSRYTLMTSETFR